MCDDVLLVLSHRQKLTTDRCTVDGGLGPSLPSCATMQSHRQPRQVDDAHLRLHGRPLGGMGSLSAANVNIVPQKICCAVLSQGVLSFLGDFGCKFVAR